jgi:hypothetical protein
MAPVGSRVFDLRVRGELACSTRPEMKLRAPYDLAELEGLLDDPDFEGGTASICGSVSRTTERSERSSR